MGAPGQHGPQTITWDGRDASGNLTDNRRAFVTFEGKTPNHLHHEAQRCHDLRITLVSDTTGELSSGGIPLVAKLVGDPAYGGEDGYTIEVLVDWEPRFVKDYPGGTTEFRLPRIGPLERGRHLVTVNVRRQPGPHRCGDYSTPGRMRVST